MTDLAVRTFVPDAFTRRHIGTTREAQATMLEAVGVASTDELMARAVPESIRQDEDLVTSLPPAVS